MGLVIRLKHGTPLGTKHEGTWYRLEVRNSDQRAACRVFASLIASEPQPRTLELPRHLSPVVSDWGTFDVQPGSIQLFHFCSLLTYNGQQRIVLPGSHVPPDVYTAALALEVSGVERAAALFRLVLAPNGDLTVQVMQRWQSSGIAPTG